MEPLRPAEPLRLDMPFDECRIIELPVIRDPRGNLAFVEGDTHVPFALRRVFYVYDVPGGSSRAGHALRNCHQFIVAISGSFDVVLDNGTRRGRYHLNQANYGLHVPPLVWRELDNFSSNAVCLVLASEAYDPNDYYRVYDEFVEAMRVSS